MTQSETLARGVAGRDIDAASARRRARLLGRILDAAPRLHERREPVAILTALEGVLLGLFPDARFLLHLSSMTGADEAVTESILRSNLGDADMASGLAVAARVTAAAAAAIDCEVERAEGRLAACVPISAGDRCFGAVYLDLAAEQVGSNDELLSALRHITVLAALALSSTDVIRARREELEIMATETGTSLADNSMSLPDAKRAFEHWLISARLKEAKGNIAAAARSLHMDRGQLSRLVKRHGIDARIFKS